MQEKGGEFLEGELVWSAARMAVANIQAAEGRGWGVQDDGRGR